MHLDTIITDLVRNGVLPDSEEAVAVEALPGGVSSDIAVVCAGERRIVIKSALPKLKVDDEWFADPARNVTEVRFSVFAEATCPGSVPRILYHNEEAGYFAMEYLGEGFANWKSELLAGRCDMRVAEWAGETLSQLHDHSRNDPKQAAAFDTGERFYALRIEPYLITTGRRNANLQTYFEAEAARLANHREALMHGDFSPKNVLISAHRIVLLDHEVACYGDPVFDLAFLLNHFCLKALYRHPARDSCLDAAERFLGSYFHRAEAGRQADMEARTGPLLAMLMLARIDGKSPVEYLHGQPEYAVVVRGFVSRWLLGGGGNLRELLETWKVYLKNRCE